MMRKILLVAAAALVAAVATAGDAVKSKASAQSVEQRNMFFHDMMTAGQPKIAPAKKAKKKMAKKSKKKAMKKSMKKSKKKM
jgi:hypothetical protein